ncbi:MAG: UDP-N-acetylmuramoyl-tripeptide--D-alanyl-D-alanine ligase [Bacteroidota bacterium]
MNFTIDKIHKLFLKSTGITTDSRTIERDNIFFALKGENFNGNKFASFAIEKGASFAIVDDKEYASNLNCILVDDVLKTLQLLATFHREQFHIPLIGITGTNGKTTTKEFINAVLSTQYKTLATKGNLNNHIGVPLTLLSITNQTEIAIIEMGANHPGEIADLCAIAKPNAAIITNIGKAHLEGFINIENIIETKTALYRSVKEVNGKTFVNVSDKILLEKAKDNYNVTYGDQIDADYYGVIESVSPYLKIKWGQKLENNIETQIAGAYNFQNIMAAIAIGCEYGISPKNINRAISEYIPSINRSQVLKTKSNTLLLDAYNANPTSMKAAIDNFIMISNPKNAMILGDMMELGEESYTEHLDIYNHIIKSGIENIFFIGEIFSSIAKAKSSINCFTNSAEALEWFKKHPLKDSFILVKGSRAMKLETLTAAL